MSRKLADAVARMCGGTRCWTAVVTGPSHRMLSALGIRNRNHAVIGDRDRNAAMNSGAVISHAIAGSLA